MSREQFAQLGAVLSAYLDMVRGQMGDQFAVNILCRHKSGPCHLLIGDDTELVLIGVLSQLQKTGLGLTAASPDQPQPEVPVDEHMANLLQEVSEAINGASANRPWLRQDQLEVCARIDDVLDRVRPQMPAQGPGVTMALPRPQQRVCNRCVEPLPDDADRCPGCGDAAPPRRVQ